MPVRGDRAERTKVPGNRGGSLASNAAFAGWLLAQRLAGWPEKYPDVVVDRVVRAGRPAERLLDLADRAQLLVVGSRGRGGFSGLALGSTSQALMSYALCPVVVARGTRPHTK